MNNPEKDKIIALIRKCLAKGDATRNNSEAEVQVALATAQRLMTEHNIKSTEVQFDSETGTLKEKVGESKVEGIRNSGWRVNLGHVVNVLCDTKFYISRGRENNKISLVFIGLPGDVEMAIAIYHELSIVVKKLEINYKKINPAGNARSFSIGVVARLLEKARKIKEYEHRPASTNALMVVKKKEVESYMSDMFRKGTLRNSANHRRGVYNGDYSAGYQAGGAVHVGRKHLQLT